MQVWSLGQEDSLEKGTATHSSILAWRIPWTEEPGGPQSMGSHRVGHDRSNLASMHTVWLKLPEVSCLDQKIHYGPKKDIYHTKSYMQRLLWGFRVFRKS